MEKYKIPVSKSAQVPGTDDRAKEAAAQLWRNYRHSMSAASPFTQAMMNHSDKDSAGNTYKPKQTQEMSYGIRGEAELYRSKIASVKIYGEVSKVQGRNKVEANAGVSVSKEW